MVLASSLMPPRPAVIQVSFQLKTEETQEKETHLGNILCSLSTTTSAASLVTSFTATAIHSSSFFHSS